MLFLLATTLSFHAFLTFFCSAYCLPCLQSCSITKEEGVLREASQEQREPISSSLRSKTKQSRVLLAFFALSPVYFIRKGALQPTGELLPTSQPKVNKGRVPSYFLHQSNSHAGIRIEGSIPKGFCEELPAPPPFGVLCCPSFWAAEQREEVSLALRSGVYTFCFFALTK